MYFLPLHNFSHNLLWLILQSKCKNWMLFAPLKVTFLLVQPNVVLCVSVELWIKWLGHSKWKWWVTQFRIPALLKYLQNILKTSCKLNMTSFVGVFGKNICVLLRRKSEDIENRAKNSNTTINHPLFHIYCHKLLSKINLISHTLLGLLVGEGRSSLLLLEVLGWYLTPGCRLPLYRFFLTLSTVSITCSWSNPNTFSYKIS